MKRLDFCILTVLTLISLWLFRNSSLDLWAARQFYHPNHAQNPWFEQSYILWRFFYVGAPWLTGILLLGSLGGIMTSAWKPSFKRYRSQFLFVFLVVAIGPGFFVNTVFKPHWGRPRPREVIELGGQHTYQEVCAPDFGGSGMSFPCGHCSVGFSFVSLAWVFRKKNRYLSASLFGASAALGGIMGVGRIADGAHFFSDVVFAGIITNWVAFGFYYFVLKLNQEDLTTDESSTKVSGTPVYLQRFFAWLEKKNSWVYGVYFLITLMILAVLVMATPFHHSEKIEFPTAKTAQLQLNVTIGNIIIEADPKAPMNLNIEAKGFGIPSSKIETHCDFSDSAIPPKWNCTIERHGIFADFEAQIKLSLNPAVLEKLEVTLQHGDIQGPQIEKPPLWNWKVLSSH